MTIISDLSLLKSECFRHCALFYTPSAKTEEEREHMKKTALPKVVRKA